MTTATATSTAGATFLTLFDEERLDESTWALRVPSAEFRKELEQRGVVSSRGGEFVVSFVGVAALGDDSCCVLPKVRPEGLDPNRFRRLVLKAIRRYAQEPRDSARDATLWLGEGPDSRSRLALADWLIVDHDHHGLITTQRRLHELNGRGTVHWPRTLSRIDPVFSAGRPVYLHLVTERRETDHDNPVRALHAFAVRQARKQYGPLLGHLERDAPELARIAAEGQYMQGRASIFLRAALRHTFQDRQIAVLRALQEWFVTGPRTRHSRFALMGVSTFNPVWESAIRSLFSSQWDDWKDSMPRPKYVVVGKPEENKPPLRPDIIRVLRPGASSTPYFLIADAKYYHLDDLPGASDVAKQCNYATLLATKAKEKLGEEPILVNAFVLPNNIDGLVRKGQVEWKELNQEPVQLWYCGIAQALESYVNSKPLDDDGLKNWINPKIE